MTTTSIGPFNTLTGLSVGLNAIPVADANGNIVTNVNSPGGNVAANVVYAASYKIANGQPFLGNPAGSNTQIQYNANGVLSAGSNLTFDYANQVLSVTGNANISGIVILGNTSSIISASGSNSNITLHPDGIGNVNVIGSLGVSGNVTFTGNEISLGSNANINITGGTSGYCLVTNGSGNLSWKNPSQLSFRIVSANASLTVTDQVVIVNAASTTVTLILPTSSSTVGNSLIIKNNSANGQVIIQTSGSDVIDGNSNARLSTQYAVLTLFSAGSNTYIVT